MKAITAGMAASPYWSRHYAASLSMPLPLFCSSQAMTSCNHHPTRRSPTLMRFGNLPFFSSLRMCCGVYGTKDTHRALWYEDGVLVKTLEAGRYSIPGRYRFLFIRRRVVEVVPVDIRERELTIKGQEILTADKVAIRVSIIVQFRVSDPKAAIHEVEKY